MTRTWTLMSMTMTQTHSHPLGSSPLFRPSDPSYQQVAVVVVETDHPICSWTYGTMKIQTVRKETRPKVALEGHYSPGEPGEGTHIAVVRPRR